MAGYLRDYPALQNVSNTQALLEKSIYMGSRVGVEAALQDEWWAWLRRADIVPNGARTFGFGKSNFERANPNKLNDAGFSPLHSVLEAPSLHYHQNVSWLPQPGHAQMETSDYEDGLQSIVHLMAHHGASFTLPDGHHLTVGDHAFANINIDKNRRLTQRDMVLGTLAGFSRFNAIWEPDIEEFFACSIIIDVQQPVEEVLLEQRKQCARQIEEVGKLVASTLRNPTDAFSQSITEQLPVQIGNYWSSRSWKIDIDTMPAPRSIVREEFNPASKMFVAAQETKRILQRWSSAALR